MARYTRCFAFAAPLAAGCIGTAAAGCAQSTAAEPRKAPTGEVRLKAGLHTLGGGRCGSLRPTGAPGSRLRAVHGGGAAEGTYR
ncbi:hypothetical protein [Luteolibacter sp. Populi]|uniref:hypothetical protein n=1 Tax=Luteolibacter sp. Populi TaxID=3230487 RepID=UPI003466B7A5